MADAILRIATHSGIGAVVGDYFDPAYGFAGHTFDDLGGGQPPDEVTVADLMAVTLLDISWSPRAVRLLLGEHRQRMSDLLRGIGDDIDLWDADDEKVAAADKAWDFLVDDLPYVGPVTAGKLLARKRPRLVPIYDQVIGRWLPYLCNVGFWETLRATLADSGLRDEIKAVRPHAETEGVALLRLLDVAVWMTGSRSENVRASHRRHGFTPPVLP